MRKFLAVAILASSVCASAANLDAGIRALYSGDFATALKEIQPLAIDGNADAQFRLCGMYFSGQGVPKNDFEAANFCKLAAQQGHVEAMYNLGLFYQNGEGVGQDFNEATRWYSAAALRGHQNAQHNLNELKQHMANALAANPLPTTPQTIMQQPQAMQPAPQQYAIQQAPMMPQTFQTIPQMPVPQGVAPMAYPPPNVIAAPIINTNGQRDPANDVEKYCLIAAQRGNPDSSCLDATSAVAAQAPAPKEKDLKWYLAESKKGNLQAKNNLGVMYRRGTGVKKDPVAAFKLFEESAAKGSVNGMMNLASMYKAGEGTAQNLELAYAWYNLSADRSPAGEQKTKSQNNVREIAAYLSNEQIGNALNYVTKLDDSIPIMGEE